MTPPMSPMQNEAFVQFVTPKPYVLIEDRCNCEECGKSPLGDWFVVRRINGTAVAYCSACAEEERT